MRIEKLRNNAIIPLNENKAPHLSEAKPTFGWEPKFLNKKFKSVVDSQDIEKLKKQLNFQSMNDDGFFKKALAMAGCGDLTPNQIKKKKQT